MYSKTLDIQNWLDMQRAREDEFECLVTNCEHCSLLHCGGRQARNLNEHLPKDFLCYRMCLQYDSESSH
jgi:hypothetical protein